MQITAFQTGTSKQKQAFTAIALAFILGGIWYAVPHPITPFAICFLPIAIFTAPRFTFWLGMGFLIFSFFRIHEAIPFLLPFKLPLLLAAGTLYALAINLIFRKTTPFIDSLHIPFLLLFIHVSIGILFSVNPSQSLAFWQGTYVKIAIMVFALSWVVTKPEHLMWASRLIIFAAFIIALVALSNKAAGLDMVEGTRVTIGRSIGSMLGDPNDLSLVLLFGAAFALSLTFQKGLPLWERIFGLVVFIAIVLAIIATQSRGGLLALAAVTGLSLSRIIKSKLTLITSGLFALLILFSVAGISDRQSGGAHEQGVDESAMGRIYAWQAATNMALQNPISGVGLKNFLNSYYFYSPHWDGKNHAVHSTWFGVLAEAGFMGLILFLWMMSRLLKALIKTSSALKTRSNPEPSLQSMSSALLAGFCGICVSGTFLTQGFIWPIYIMLALSIALNRMVSQNETSTKQPSATK